MDVVLSWLPDEPWYVEARSMLLSGRGSVVWCTPDAAVMHAPLAQLACAAGKLRWSQVEAALDALPVDVELVVREADVRLAGEWPRAWKAEAAIVHVEAASAPISSAHHPARMLTEADRSRLQHVPTELREELEYALTISPVAAVFDDRLPVSFCYAGWETERWWDVSIDTLEPWRNRGFAADASIALMEVMRARGKRAVWAALETNVPSLRVARRLGFELVGRVFVLSRR